MTTSADSGSRYPPPAGQLSDDSPQPSPRNARGLVDRRLGTSGHGQDDVTLESTEHRKRQSSRVTKNDTARRSEAGDVRWLVRLSRTSVTVAYLSSDIDNLIAIITFATATIGAHPYEAGPITSKDHAESCTAIGLAIALASHRRCSARLMSLVVGPRLISTAAPTARHRCFMRRRPPVRQMLPNKTQMGRPPALTRD